MEKSTVQTPSISQQWPPIGMVDQPSKSLEETVTYPVEDPLLQCISNALLDAIAIDSLLHPRQ